MTKCSGDGTDRYKAWRLIEVMAGIGFSLNRLFQKKGMLNLCRAYAYAGAVAIGPMVMGVCLLLGISFVSQIAGMPQGEREIMNCMLTYSLLVSLFVSSFMNMILTRYISDMLYEGKRERIMPSFYGALAVMLPAAQSDVLRDPGLRDHEHMVLHIDAGVFSPRRGEPFYLSAVV